MAYRNEVKPLNLFADYLGGRQAAVEEQGAKQVNALRGLQVQRQTGLNALAQDPNATPEQYIRAGDAQTGVALGNEQQAGQADKQQAMGQVATIAQKALTITDPAQRKAFIGQAMQAYGHAFQALGIDHMQGIAGLQQYPDAELDSTLQHLAQFAAPPKPIEVPAGGSIVLPNAQGTAFTPAFTAPNPGQEETARHNKAMEGLVSQKASAAILTPEGQDLAAQEYLNTGKLPPGMGGAQTGVNAKIIGRAAEMAAANGNDAQATALNRASFKAGQTGLTALTKQRTLVGAFERTALKNLEIALDESNKVDRTGVTPINKWLIAGKKATGDVEVGRFNAALTSALNEYAKVLSGATGSAGISDAARREAHDLLNTANTPEQVIGIVDIMKREMANREAGFAEQEAQLKETMGARPNVPVAPASPGAPQAPGAPMGATPVQTATGPNGQKLYLRNGQWVQQ